MCGKGRHVADYSREDGIKYCYMDYFCDNGFCECKHDNGCDCTDLDYDPDEDDDEDCC